MLIFMQTLGKKSVLTNTLLPVRAGRHKKCYRLTDKKEEMFMCPPSYVGDTKSTKTGHFHHDSQYLEAQN